jgi:hypothetical protein
MVATELQPALGVVVVLAALGAVAAELLIRRRRRRPQTSKDHVRAGDRALARGDLDRAAELYREAIRLDHANLEARYNLASAAWYRGDFDGAIELLLDIRQLAPDDPHIEHNLGAAYHHKGDHEKAVEHYRRAVDLDPEARDAQHSLAVVYHELGRTAEAGEVCPAFVPPGPEAEAWERAWEQLGPEGQARLRGWDKAGRALLWVTLAAGAVFLACILLFMVGLVYEIASQPATSWLVGYGAVYAIALKGSGAVALASGLAMRATEAARGRFMRRLMARSGVSSEDADLIAPPPAREGPPLWRVEVSGFHLLMWLGLPVLVYFWRTTKDLPDWTVLILIYLLFGWACKGFIWLQFITADADYAAVCRRQHRWLGTVRGTLFMLVGVPAIAAAAWVIICRVLDLVGW